MRKEISLRLSITDRCNLRCIYCMPPEGVPYVDHQLILRYETMVQVARILNTIRPLRKLRITGGEPLARKGVVGLVSALAAALPDTELCLTTNAALLAPVADALKVAGLSRVNISLDTLDGARFRELTRGGRIEDALAGIRAAARAGLTPVKINCVLLRGINEDEWESFVHFAMNEGVSIRFLELMSIGRASALWRDLYMPASQCLRRLAERFEIQPLGHETTADLYRVQRNGSSAAIGFIRPVSEPFCDQCNRLRLDARGRLSACLVASDRLDIGAMLRAGASEEVVAREVELLLACKTPPQVTHSSVPMSSVGG